MSIAKVVASNMLVWVLNIQGGFGAALVVFGVAANYGPTHQWISSYMTVNDSRFDSLVTLATTVLTLISTLIISASVYFQPHQRKPEAFSTVVSAWVVIGSSIIALLLLMARGSIPSTVVAGFSLLGLTGSIFRLLPFTWQAGPWRN